MTARQPSSADIAAILAGQPVGKQMWIAVRGRSMWPLLRGGESLKVERCEPDALKPGDLAVLMRGDGQLIAHLVVSTSPLTTSSFSGTVDPPGLLALARCVAVRRGRLTIPFSALAPWVLQAQQLYAELHRAEAVRTVWSASRAWVGSSWTAPLRSALFAPDVRLLLDAELSALAVTLSRWEPVPGPVLEAAVAEGRAAGVLARGTLRGVGLRSEDGVLRHLHLSTWVQQLGVADRLLEVLWTPGVRAIEVAAAEDELVKACHGRGFQRAGEPSGGRWLFLPPG